MMVTRRPALAMLDVWDATRHDDTARIRAAVTAYARLTMDAAWSRAARTLARRWEQATAAAGDPARLDDLLHVADDLILALFTYADARALLMRLRHVDGART